MRKFSHEYYRLIRDAAFKQIITYSHYDPQVGRFVQQDPIGLAAGDTNLYRYVENNSTRCSDPLGLYIIDATYGYLPDAVKTSVIHRELHSRPETIIIKLKDLPEGVDSIGRRWVTRGKSTRFVNGTGYTYLDPANIELYGPDQATITAIHELAHSKESLDNKVNLRHVDRAYFDHRFTVPKAINDNVNSCGGKK